MAASPVVYENLAKRVAYFDNQPSFQAEIATFLALTGYRIDRTFDDPTTGFHAIGLVSLNPTNPPVLVFRGVDGLADDSTLIDPRGIGLSQFQANKTAIEQWLRDAKTNSTNPNQLLPDLLGHSLGGALVQQTAAELTSLVGDIVTFNSPAVSLNTVNTFKQNGGANKNVTHYIVNGDFVSLAGEAFLPGKAILQSYTIPTIDPLANTVPGNLGLDKHTRLLFTNPPQGLNQAEISGDRLNSPSFSYPNDSNFTEFISALTVGDPQLLAVSSRGSLEQARTSSGFSYFGLLSRASNVLNLTKDNFLVGDNLNNLAVASSGNDTIFGAEGNDTLLGNQGFDIISGGKDSDVLFGGKGNDTLLGGQGNDSLYGDLGSDRLSGDLGNDTLVGVSLTSSSSPGLGEIDILTGGTGNDVFILGDSLRPYYIGNGNGDYALSSDFNPSEDFLQVNRGQTITFSVSPFSSQDLALSIGGDLVAVLQNQSLSNQSLIQSRLILV